MIAGVLVGAGCVLAGVAAGYVVARASAAQLVVRPNRVVEGDDDPPVFAQSEASEYLRELQDAELNGMHAAGWEDAGVYIHGHSVE